MKLFLTTLLSGLVLATTTFAGIFDNPQISVTVATNQPVAGYLLTTDGQFNYWGVGTPGPIGPQGLAGTIVINSTSNGVPGSQAEVTNTGTPTNASLNFIIPTGSNGPAGPKGDQGDKGDKGDTGNTGATGTAATITVGYTSNGIPGSTAVVSNSGDTNNAIFDFIIPTGSNGPAGPKGDTGNTGATGSTGTAATITVGYTSNSIPGSSAIVTNSGDSNNAIFNFVIPTGSNGPVGPKGDQGDKGDKGDTGNTGATGLAATVTVGYTSNGLPGSAASVVNSGTTNNAILDFMIPTGSNGPAGPQGPAGSFYRYQANGDAGAEVEVTATSTNVTAVWDTVNKKLTMTIPAGVNLISLRVRVPYTTHTASGNWSLILGTTDMGNTSFANRWGALFLANREDTGAQVNTANCKYDISNHDTLLVVGMISGTTTACRFGF